MDDAKTVWRVPSDSVWLRYQCDASERTCSNICFCGCIDTRPRTEATPAVVKCHRDSLRTNLQIDVVVQLFMHHAPAV